jgi:hypothetical protein
MPLTRAHEYFKFEPSDGLYFGMTDGTASILCKISCEALRDCRALDGGDASLRDTFVRHRERIEAIADQKHRQGHRPNALVLVLSKDLTPAVA